ncbi:MAG TPA: DUF4249 domain-containing protein [Segetibacter sp.]|nr:DUF4249 domain-containing protein [Segetibacter sp.]
MFWYRHYTFIASSLRRNHFVCKSLGSRVKSFQIQWLALAVVIFAAGCREPFDPNIRPEQTNFLVVEGFINAQGSTNITLSRTTQLNDSAAIQLEQGAALTIMGEDNSKIPLVENTSGHYHSDSLTLNKNQKYRLLIHTIEGKEYLSEYVAVKQTPPIDSVSWDNQNDGAHIYVNSHDPQNNTLYYKWDYLENWEIQSHYDAAYKYYPGDAPDGSEGSIRPRDMNEMMKMKYCWQKYTSTNIHVGSSVPLASDIISLEPVVFITRGSEKLSVRYSILVKQYALDKQAYEFYQLIKKNTESIGSIFDPQPSDITGNIHCTSNPGEKVIGYIMATTQEEKRIFITNEQVMGAQWLYDPQCVTVYVENNTQNLISYFRSGNYIPYSEKPPGEGYYSVTANCADCRTRGGNDKPDFW